MAHGNISVFVPHIGCPHKCSFCNQVKITGSAKCPTAEDVSAAISEAEAHKNYDAASTQLAFFGGSFTAIPRDYRLELLSAGYDAVKRGRVSSVRISTRPDCIDEEILSELSQYGVKSIELGAQSMDDGVLVMNERGHTSKDVENACLLIRSHGFELGLQMMTGLYGDTAEKSIDTAKKIIALNPDTVRIYPAIVLKNTRLAELYDSGKYRPQTVDEAADLCADLIKMFRQANVNVIRVGLHSIDYDGFVAGPWHPAFGEKVMNKYFLNMAKTELYRKPAGSYNILVNPKDVSKMTGQKKQNLAKLSKDGYSCRVVAREDVPQETIITEEEN